MWKVVIIMCALGNPCVIMEESPMKHYQNYNDCMVVAEAKHTDLLEAFQEYGYWVENSDFKCENPNDLL